MIMVLALSLQFDGEAGETFSNACAIFCRNQSHGLEVLRSKIRKDQKAACFLQVSLWETVAGPERVGFQSLDTRHCTTCLTKSRRTFFRILISLQKKDILFYVFRSFCFVWQVNNKLALLVICSDSYTEFNFCDSGWNQDKEGPRSLIECPTSKHLHSSQILISCSWTLTQSPGGVFQSVSVPYEAVLYVRV